MHLLRVPGVALEPLGQAWVAFSPLSGETHLLNDTSAAIIECLSEHLPMALDALYAELGKLSGVTPEDVARVCASAWPGLVEAGVVRVGKALAGGEH